MNFSVAECRRLSIEYHISVGGEVRLDRHLDFVGTAELRPMDVPRRVRPVVRGPRKRSL